MLHCIAITLKLALSITVLMWTSSLDTTLVDLSVACAIITTMMRSGWLFLYSEYVVPLLIKSELMRFVCIPEVTNLMQPVP